MSMKKILTFTAAIILLMPMLGHLDSNAECTETMCEAEANYIEDVLPTYLNIEDYDMNAINVVMMNDLENGSKNYIVYNDNETLGLLNVTEIEGIFYSSFEFGNFDKFQSNTVMCCSGVPFDTQISNQVSLTATTKTIVYQYNMNVPIVSSVILDGVNSYWLSPLVSKYNYLYEDDFTLFEVKELLIDIYEGTPSDTADWREDAALALEVGNTVVDAPLDYIDVYGQITFGNPIYMYMDSSAGKNAALLCGFTLYSDGTAVYKIMDPNRTSLVNVSVPSSAMTDASNFVYSASYGTIYTWEESMY